MHKIFLFILGLLIVHTAHALQIKEVSENATVPATIASQDITRIFVKADRIQSVRGIKGAYVRENDEAQGEIYVQPTPAYQRHAFTLLITTETGRHFTLLLTPLAVPSDTLMLIPQGVGSKKATAYEQASTYDLTLIHLIQAMVKGRLPDGYARQPSTVKKCKALNNLVTLQPLSIYEGVHFRGEVFELINTQSHPLLLDEQNFYIPGTRAISVDTVVVVPHQKIRLYRVVSHA